MVRHLSSGNVIFDEEHDDSPNEMQVEVSSSVLTSGSGYFMPNCLTSGMKEFVKPGTPSQRWHSRSLYLLRSISRDMFRFSPSTQLLIAVCKFSSMESWNSLLTSTVIAWKC